MVNVLMPRLPSILRLPLRLSRRRRRSRMATLFLVVMVTCLIILPFYIIYKPPNMLIRYFERRWPQILWQVRTADKIVALTIDDGPSQYSRDIMQVLASNNAAATLFIIGSQTSGREDVLREMVRNGHELGNHAMHDEPSRSLSDAELVRQIDEVRGRLEQAYEAANMKAPPLYFRPGSGFFSTRMFRVLERLRYQGVLGSIYPHDAQIPYAGLNARHILSMVRPGGIIVCHDRRSWTAPMLSKVLPELRRRGYRIVTVTGLLQSIQSRDG